ncbi:hypothetical protein Scep_029411 [Stephania cephalantha]|uniref:Thiaminase-2/PQQC domain-containing protein n=1 Tax=Stephania cephalantha TaxID=152367 RepID=A0AAP0E0L1_9MAGN
MRCCCCFFSNSIRIASSISSSLQRPRLTRFIIINKSNDGFIDLVKKPSFYARSHSSDPRDHRQTFLASSSLSSSSSSASSGAMRVVAAAATEAEDERVARRFWNKCRRESAVAMYTPFVVCLASGTLEMEAFRNYLAQDVHFLTAFAQAYELAEECADDDDAKVVICELRKAVVVELKMHDSFMKEWGFDPEAETTSNSATKKYIDFLLATASGKVEGGKAPVKIATPFEKTKVAAYTLGAMTPCMRLYAFLGKELQALVDPDDISHPFRRWIDNYSSDDFEASAQKTEDLLDKLSVSLTGEELGVIEKLYQQAMKLEIEFFSAQPITQKTVVPLFRMHDHAQKLFIFSDFDLTCTVHDSSAILAEVAILTAQKVSHDNDDNLPSKRSSADLRMIWDSLSKQYAEEYEQCLQSALPSVKEEEFNYNGLCEALVLVSDFEKRANSRVVESGVLKGISLEDIKRAGELLKLQDGCLGFFQNIVKNEKLGANVHLLSYCWCGDLIRSSFSSGGLDTINVHANELNYEDSISTGTIVNMMESPRDKFQAFEEILKKKNDGSSLSVYIGDSVGDLLCLLQADIGIVIGSSLSLRRLASHFGVSFVPLFSGLVKRQKEFAVSDGTTWKAPSGVLYTVSTWAEIHAFILGFENH